MVFYNKSNPVNPSDIKVLALTAFAPMWSLGLADIPKRDVILNKIEKVYIGFTAFVVTMIYVGRPWLGLLLSGPFIRAWIAMVDNSEE